MKKVAIVQSNYIPWKGYFDLIASVDEFIIYDEVQFTRRDWRNRNRIKTPNGTSWLTIPVETKGGYFQSIQNTRISQNNWREKHLASLAHNYRRAPYYNELKNFTETVYSQDSNNLSEVNIHIIKEICGFFEIKTKINLSSNYELSGDKSEKLASICEQSGADVYISGPNAKNYLDYQVFKKRKIKVDWFNYENYPVYQQLWGDFEHSVTILDLLYNCGPKSRKFMKYL